MLLWLSALLIWSLSSLYFPFHSNTHVFHGAQNQEETKASRILLLTAHPDDECLFFAPTLLALRNDPTYTEIYSLTMSVGNADGLGEIRKEELTRSLDVMGVDLDKRWVVDHPMLQDNITVEWDASVIAVVLAPYVVNNQISIILTFDSKGISSHPNHYSLPFGAWNLANTLRSSPKAGPASVLRVFGLVTKPVVPKYMGILASLTSRIRIVLSRILNLSKNQRVVFTSGVREYMTAVRAMREHATQLEWFRYLYVTFSRYMWVNEWVEFEPADV